ncbi:phosphoribosylformylglycinamidine synthase-like isoform X2 [Dreissena polymorpha]|nr:phosphoribosylformylglycinamidine synthase-like isoform X2 [Dreissena polymorpha]
MVIQRYFKRPGLTRGAEVSAGRKISTVVDSFKSLRTEACFYVESNEGLDKSDMEKLRWLFSTPFTSVDCLTTVSALTSDDNICLLVEIGPRSNFSTPFSTNAVSICKAIGLVKVTRIEVSTRYLISFYGNPPPLGLEQGLVNCLHDKMTQCRYVEPIQTFDLDHDPDPVYDVDLMERGRKALEEANVALGLAFDDWDLDFYTHLFQEKVKRNPTNVECFDLAQSNSEHSRHWFFRGRLVIDGEEVEGSLFKMIMATQEHSNDNNIIKFNDNSSGIQGFDVEIIRPNNPAEPSQMMMKREMRHIIFTAETHNFPTGVAPFPGATTGTGGRIRDVHCTGRGALVVAGTAGYCFGNLNIPGYTLPWEDESFAYPPNFASPLDIAIEASNGASDYGNKFGEPVLTGFARSFGLEVSPGDRREYIKPIMFSGGIGQLMGSHIKKETPVKGMEVVKVGGPVYRIGVGGGAASSVQVQGDNKCELDFGAVQRGDAEMEQKLNRVIRACVELADHNPIASIHDQGAGGNGNVLKEIVEPAGAVIRAKDFQLGDPTISILELWGAEYQETNAMLVARENMGVLAKIGRRERCPVSFVGTVTGDGRICLEDFPKSLKGSPQRKRQKISNAKRSAVISSNGKMAEGNVKGLDGDGDNSSVAEADVAGIDQQCEVEDAVVPRGSYPVDLDLEHVLGKMPQKVFNLTRGKLVLRPLSLPEGLTVREALQRVLRLPSVASKRYLTNKVDRCVTGLVAQQQCVGPLHTPLADVAVTALSYTEKVGSATAIGEQPIKGLLDPACGARMSVGEALTNLVFAKVTDIKDIKCSGNWMWPAKLPGEGAGLVEACRAMCDVMGALGIAVDGGKDSLSMAARMDNNTVKAPGTLVISAYVGCPDITLTVTPDLKCPDNKGQLLHVDIGSGPCRLGGTALAQCFKQLGTEAPDLDHPEALVAAFQVTQTLIEERKISSGHDISDGGLITACLEMAFAGNCGVCLDIKEQDGASPLARLFHEELGLILEVKDADVPHVMERYAAVNVPCSHIGHSIKDGPDSVVSVKLLGNIVLEEKMVVLRDIWEQTSFQLEMRQSNPDTVRQEQDGLRSRTEPPYQLTFDPDIVHIIPAGKQCPRVAILREEGSNSDREMAAAFMMSGCEVWDVNMQDLVSGAITLDQFHGLAFVGGFSYADVLGSAKGWSATALFNASVREQLLVFQRREDTFSFGVCNGCQLMSLLGWVAPDVGDEVDRSDDTQPCQGVFLDHNDSERFECRYVTVRVNRSPAIMFRGMEGSMFGMWSAHGEGKMVFKSHTVYHSVKSNNLIPLSYVDDAGKATMVYPFNPNGSVEGVAALCSPDGRHLAIMPHPERSFQMWQLPWIPEGMKGSLDASPWLQMFQNAFDWSVQKINE